MKFLSVKEFEQHIENNIKTVDDLADLVESYRLPSVDECSKWQSRKGIIGQYDKLTEEGDFPCRVFVASPIIQVASDHYTTEIIGFNIDEQRKLVF